MSRALQQQWPALIVGLGLQLSLSTFAYELKTHEEMTRFAFDRSASINGDLFMRLGIEESATTKVFPGVTGFPKIAKQLMADGARYEDNWPRPINHFFNPLTGLGLGLAYSAPDWALSDNEDQTALFESYSYRDARRAYYDALSKPNVGDREVALGRVFETLGHVVHLIQDMAQPQHVRNDSHYDKVEATYSRYEKMTEKLVRDNAGAITFTGYPNAYQKNDSRSLTSPRAFWQTGALGLAGVQQGKGLAQFTNRNFVSSGTNFGGSINRLSAYSGAKGTFPLPDPALARVSAPIDVSSLDPTLPPGEFMLFVSTPVTETLFSEYQGATNQRASTFSIFDQDLALKGSSMVFALNKFNFAAARDFLIPRAVAYSAGMIDYFFRGDIDLLPDPTLMSRYVIANYNVESMKGTFALFYDALDGTRKPLSGAKWDGMSVAGFNPTSGKPGISPSIRIAPPADAKQAGKYMLVFLGDMGEEKQGDGSPIGGFAYGAVVGRLVIAVPLEALYVAGVDAGGRLISLRVDEGGTHVINGPDVNGVVRQSQEFDPVRALVAPNVLNRRPYYWKQAHFLDGSGGSQYRIQAVNTPGGAFVRDPATQNLGSTAAYWTARSADPAVGWFTFYASAATPNSGTLFYTRTYADAQGKTQSSSGSIPLPALPNYDPSAPSTNYQAFAFNGELVPSEDGLTIYGFKTAKQTYSPPGPWNPSTPYPRTLTTTVYGITLQIGLAPTPIAAASVIETTTSVESESLGGSYDESYQANCPYPPIKTWNQTHDSSSSFVAPGEPPGTDRSWVGIFAGALSSFTTDRSVLSTQHDEQRSNHSISGATSWSASGLCDWMDTWTFVQHYDTDYKATTTYHLKDGDIQSTAHSYRVTDDHFDPSPYVRSYHCLNWSPSCQVASNGSVNVSTDTGDQFDNRIETPTLVLRPDSGGVVFSYEDYSSGTRASGMRFRGIDITGKDFVGDVSPLGEIFFATSDLTTVIHEPVNGRMPLFVRPPNMVKILAALWL